MMVDTEWRGVRLRSLQHCCVGGDTEPQACKVHPCIPVALSSQLRDAQRMNQHRLPSAIQKQPQIAPLVNLDLAPVMALRRSHRVEYFPNISETD